MSTEATMTHGKPGGAASPAPAIDFPVQPKQVIAWCDAAKAGVSILRSEFRLGRRQYTELELTDMATDLQSVSRCVLEMAEEFKQAARAQLGKGRQ